MNMLPKKVLLFYVILAFGLVVGLFRFTSLFQTSHSLLPWNIIFTNVSASSNNISSVSYAVTSNPLNAMTPEQIARSNRLKPKSPPAYLDRDYLKSCKVSKSRSPLYELLKWWIDFAGKHDIVWWLRDGTLIGSLRHGDIVPWDTDMDLAIMGQYEPLIRNLSAIPPNISAHNIQIISRPAEHCVNNAPRRSCSGQKVTHLVDGCSFCGPLARIFKTPGIRIDLYLANVEFDEGQLVLYDESHHEYSTDRPLYPLHWIFPLRNCTLMDLDVLCPGNSETYLNNYYGEFTARYICDPVKKTWIKVPKTSTSKGMLLSSPSASTKTHPVTSAQTASNNILKSATKT